MKYYLLIFIFVDWTIGCPIDCSVVDCAQSFDPLKCPNGTLYSNNGAICGCCPGCVKFKGPGEQCTGETKLTMDDIKNYYTEKAFLSTGVIPVVAPRDCAPGLKCIDTKCSSYPTKYTCTTPDITNTKWSPECDIDGSHKAVQCKTSSANPMCFCYSKEGNRIFGLDWLENRDEMKCLCSRLVNDLKKDPKNDDLTYHCSSNGNFEPLQCNRGTCYCADIYTGQPTSYVVQEQWWKTLPCYNKTTMGFKYLKTCDSQSHALAMLTKELNTHGSSPQLEVPPCDPDGSYSPKQCNKDRQCFCHTRANVRIGTYATEVGTESERIQKCYCARDQVIFADADRTHTLACDSGGNYVALQTARGKAICVDQDGFFTTDEVPLEEKCSLPCSKNVEGCRSG